MGMDLVIVILVVLFALLGYYRGLLRHLASVGALVVASLTAGIVGRWAVGLLTRAPAMPSPTTYAIACVAAWVVVFLLSRFVLGRIAKKLGSDEQGGPKPWNRKLGALAGAAEVLLLAWVVVGILDALPEDFRKERLPTVHRELEGSLFTNWVVRPTSPATLLEIQPLVSDLAVLSEHPEALRGVEQKPEIQKVARHPKVLAVLADPALIQEWTDGHYGRFFSDRKVREALEDSELRTMIRELPVRAILHEAAERARQQTPKPASPQR
ncbi:MAG TPA: CvpA family protein [Planctomycetota bacterium]|nr:CvpA family protein [Planctomycetota bacterium]